MASFVTTSNGRRRSSPPKSKWREGDAYRVGSILSGSPLNAPVKNGPDLHRELESEFAHIQNKLQNLRNPK